MSQPIQLYSWATPNGHKVHIMLEEMGLDYVATPINIGKGDQFEPDFLAISPNNKIPAILDPQGPDGESISIFESAAILIYLAEKCDSDFLPQAPRKRLEVMQWLMFQMGSVGPMLGQTHHFRGYAPYPIPYAIDRYTKETTRIYGVMDKRLGEADYLAGELSIADIACFPWIASWKKQGQQLDAHPNLHRWFDALFARPAFARGMTVLKDLRADTYTDEEKEKLFGIEQKK